MIEEGGSSGGSNKHRNVSGAKSVEESMHWVAWSGLLGIGSGFLSLSDIVMKS